MSFAINRSSLYLMYLIVFNFICVGRLLFDFSIRNSFPFRQQYQRVSTDDRIATQSICLCLQMSMFTILCNCLFLCIWITVVLVMCGYWQRFIFRTAADVKIDSCGIAKIFYVLSAILTKEKGVNIVVSKEPF